MLRILEYSNRRLCVVSKISVRQMGFLYFSLSLSISMQIFPVNLNKFENIIHIIMRRIHTIHYWKSNFPMNRSVDQSVIVYRKGGKFYFLLFLLHSLHNVHACFVFTFFLIFSIRLLIKCYGYYVKSKKNDYFGHLPSVMIVYYGYLWSLA